MDVPSAPDPDPSDGSGADGSVRPLARTTGPGGARRRGLSRRTLYLCVAVATVAALGAAFVTSAVLGRDDSSSGSDRATLVRSRTVTAATLRSAPLTSIDGRKVTLGPQLDRGPALINLWAQSCVPCVREMPLLEAFHQADDRVAVIGVDVMDRLDKAKEMATKTGITYDWVRDPDGRFANRIKATGLPETLLVARGGKVLARKTGAFHSNEELRDWVDGNLTGSRSGSGTGGSGS